MAIYQKRSSGFHVAHVSLPSDLTIQRFLSITVLSPCLILPPTAFGPHPHARLRPLADISEKQIKKKTATSHPPLAARPAAASSPPRPLPPGSLSSRRLAAHAVLDAHAGVLLSASAGRTCGFGGALDACFVAFSSPQRLHHADAQLWWRADAQSVCTAPLLRRPHPRAARREGIDVGPSVPAVCTVSLNSPNRSGVSSTVHMSPNRFGS
jgi:hypothetical protein